jgi:quercetin dioxygenase-like cupin family protein
MKSVRLAASRCIPASLLVVLTVFTGRGLHSQEPAGTTHAHAAGVACEDVPPGKPRPEFGCFNVATENGLHFPQRSVYWHIRAFPNRDDGEAAKSPTGIVVEEDGRVWLSEFGARKMKLKGGQPVAIVGPLHMPPAKSYTAVLSYAVMRPGDSSRVHTHAGPEGWYMLAGEQCLETPAGAHRAKAGETMTVATNVPMALTITGKVLRKSLVLVMHDSSLTRATLSQWKPSGACKH